jgi:hypothetical protein
MMFKVLPSLLCLVLFLSAFLIDARSQKCNVDSGFLGGGFDIYYEQRNYATLFRKLGSLPKPVRQKLETYLKTRVGKKFYAKLKFDEGRRLDLKRLGRDFPDLYKSNEQLGSYYLLFYFKDESKGLKSFFADMRLRDDGSVSEDIKLPNIANEPSKGNIISCREVSQIAEKNGFALKDQSIWFQYSKDTDSFVWEVTGVPVEPDNSGGVLGLIMIGKGTFRKMDIDATTGSVRRIYKYTIVL